MISTYIFSDFCDVLPGSNMPTFMWKDIHGSNQLIALKISLESGLFSMFWVFLRNDSKTNAEQ